MFKERLCGGLEMKADDGSVGCRKGEVAAF